VTLALFPCDRLPPRLASAGWKRELHVRGQLAAGAAVAIVGARAASADAMTRAHALAAHLAGRGVHVVSGGALGVDGAAHRGALAGGGTTTVVLGSGVDVPYPRRHAALFAQIVDRGGALVSMFPCGTEPRPGTFPARNKLIAALADAVIVVEADVASGSLSTAAAAKKLGRAVAAWPGSRGCATLLANGAAIVESAADADALLAGAPRMPSAPGAMAALDPIAARVAAALRGGARGVDGVVAVTGLTVREVLRALPAIESGFPRRTS
jgi:DNA processing protein